MLMDFFDLFYYTFYGNAAFKTNEAAIAAREKNKKLTEANDRTQIHVPEIIK